MRGKLNKPVVCANGFKMSVQANAFAYCKPRQDNATKYKFVEVGFPSADENLTDTVYPHVPCALVALVIAKHGGMVSGEVPPGVAQLRPIEEDKTNV